ncbi:unnamed protein product [Symbiodinium natans]|uniref:Ankyrin repeat domain-containing protein n=1 Tax=Symbiodinium natans TaxID=878477 RepID=A0A812MRC5_9DINO|nr:unnamed protein product [Symbiodinium natans]
MTCLLIKNQADVNFANNKYDEQNRHAGKTALSFAAEQADTDMTATLLNYGADVEAGMAPQSTFWILQNLGGPKFEQVKQMIMTMMAQSRMGFNRWVFPVSGRRDLPVSHDTEALERDLLRTASMPGSDATGRLKSLLDVVDLGCKDFRGRCALWKASFSGDIDKVEWLVRAKADLDQTAPQPGSEGCDTVDHPQEFIPGPEKVPTIRLFAG